MTVSLIDQEAILKAYAAGLRLDGRAVDEYRHIGFTFSPDTRGQVLVQLGDSKVQVIVTAALERPFPDRPFEGQVGFFLEVADSAVNQEGFGSLRTGASSVDVDAFSSRLQRTLERTFRQSRALDAESLCVLTGQRVWNVRVDVRVLDDDGNVQDAVIMAALAALIDFRRPDVTVDTESGEVIVHSAFEKHPVPLALHHLPVSMTLGLMPDAKGFLLDPSALESVALAGQLTVVMNRQSEIVHLLKPGGVAFESDFLLEEIVPLCRVQAVKLIDLVQSAVAQRPL